MKYFNALLWGIVGMSVITGVYMLMLQSNADKATVSEPEEPYIPDIQSEIPVLAKETISINGLEYEVEVAENSADRKRGLSGRKTLGDIDGLLFVFPATGIHGIWMKDMNFSIDVIWLDEKGVVLNVTEELTPESFPSIYKPVAPARYAIETNPGFAANIGLEAGSLIELPDRLKLE